MPRSNRVTTMDDLINGSCNIRKRGCSPSSSSSSRRLYNNYRFKRAILVGKTRVGGPGSRSSTPVPTWKMTPLRVAESPKFGGSQSGGKSRPVSARKLAATLWEMNEVPSVRRENLRQEEEAKVMRREMRVRERMMMKRENNSGCSLPPHLSDPSHSPVSQRMDRSGTGSRQRRASSISHKLSLADHNVGVSDSLSNASLMEIETRSRAETASGSVVEVRTRLKDVSNALTTSKELLKIINRVWAHADQPSSSMPLVSALHAELERARLLVNQLLQEQCSDQNEINYLIKCFAEEKSTWKIKEQKSVEAAIDSMAAELEVERTLRKRVENLNKKLGKELSDTKTTFVKAVKEIEDEKRAREIMEHVCDELARDIGKDRAEVEELKRESTKVHEEVEKEREMLQLADILREDRVQMKLSEAKHKFEEKNAAVDKLKKQLSAFLGTKSGKKNLRGSVKSGNDEEIAIAAYLSRTRSGSHQKDKKEDDGEVEDVVDSEEDSAESELHSIELNMDNNNKSYNWAYTAAIGRDSGRVSIDDEMKGRNSTSGKVQRRSTSLQRSVSDGVEWGVETTSIQNTRDGLDWERCHENEKQAQRKSNGDEMQKYKSVKGFRDHILSSSRLGSSRDFASPTRQVGQPLSLLDPGSIVQERPIKAQGSGGGSKSRLSEARGEGQHARRSKR